MISVSGIRGIVGETMTHELVGDFSSAFATVLGGGTVIVARDSRPSGPELSTAVTASLRAAGCNVIDLGIVSTPGAALMVRALGADGGIVITASHNPSPWNGLKFLSSAGLAPPQDEASAIWALRESRQFKTVPYAEHGGYATDDTTNDRHAQTVLDRADLTAAKKCKFKVVLDSVNGAGGEEGRMLLEAIGCEIVHLNAEPHGRFAHAPEPLAENLTQLSEAVRSHKADIGFAQDPDADRCAIVDDQGRYIGEEFTLALAAKFMFKAFPGPAVTNLSTSRMIDDLANAAGGPCTVHRTAVGEANVVEGLGQFGGCIGGEGNGGVIDPAVVPVRDSLVAMSATLQLLALEGRPLSAVLSDFPRYVMIKHKFECDRDRIGQILDRLKVEFADARINDLDGVRIDWPDAWVHVRASNTEPIIRIIAEAPSDADARSILAKIETVTAPVLA
jgi:phosphomannomutase